MATLVTYHLTNEDIEEIADLIKVTIMDKLRRDGILDLDRADDWCKTHTVIIVKKSVFRTISEFWKNAGEYEGLAFEVVER